MNDIKNVCDSMIFFTNANIFINKLYEWFCSNKLSLNLDHDNECICKGAQGGGGSVYGFTKKIKPIYGLRR